MLNTANSHADFDRRGHYVPRAVPQPGSLLILACESACGCSSGEKAIALSGHDGSATEALKTQCVTADGPWFLNFVFKVTCTRTGNIPASVLVTPSIPNYRALLLLTGSNETVNTLGQPDTD